MLPPIASGAEAAPKPKSRQSPSAAIPIPRKAISQIDSEDGWVLLGEVGGQVSNLFSDFDMRSYGHNKLSDLVRKTGAFDVEKSDNGQLADAGEAGRWQGK
ncbi:OST-HTH/LOTUS domain-containing protein [Bradyrhizobium sediminis]|uniref:OST-HTH/LOTUS domain-containing protein n=1 Tax=Bradyrhizobium sediminis TaxID=2840469 RepID=UPI00201CA425|nr:OST-HTH/LOTUS domain-containing protein [Bradyrhizobium sediminis]